MNSKMIASWRWFGKNDPINLSMIKATGVKNLVHAMETPSGGIWKFEDLKERKAEIEKYGIKWTVIESLPWSASMLLGDQDRDKHLENYLTSLKNIAEAWCNEEKPVVLYNLMLWADWYRTSFSRELPEGNLCGEFIVSDMVTIMKPENIKPAIEKMAKMRGWNSIYGVEEALNLLEKSQAITAEQLWKNICICLEKIIPLAEKLGIKLAVHPDVPPRSIFGIPRVMHEEEHFQKLLNTFPSPVNGICFCVGSLGANKKIDLFGMLERMHKHVHNAHWRTVQRLDDEGSFYEAPHDQGSVPLVKVVKEFITLGISCNYRADHAEWIWKNIETKITDGYSGIGRLSATKYLNGIITGIEAA